MGSGAWVPLINTQGFADGHIIDLVILYWAAYFTYFSSELEFTQQIKTVSRSLACLGSCLATSYTSLTIRLSTEQGTVSLFHMAGQLVQPSVALLAAEICTQSRIHSISMHFFASSARIHQRRCSFKRNLRLAGVGLTDQSHAFTAVPQCTDACCETARQLQRDCIWLYNQFTKI